MKALLCAAVILVVGAALIMSQATANEGYVQAMGSMELQTYVGGCGMCKGPLQNAGCLSECVKTGTNTSAICYAGSEEIRKCQSGVPNDCNMSGSVTCSSKKWVSETNEDCQSPRTLVIEDCKKATASGTVCQP